MRPWMMAAGLALALCAPALAQDVTLARIVAAPGRDAANSVRDGARHPGASLTFWGLKPHMTVIEVAPGGGYWSEILAPYAHQTGGHYIAAMGRIGQTLPAKFADKAVYGDIGYTTFSNVSGAMGPPASADLVLTARNIHNWLWMPGMAKKFMHDAFAVLKPGGILAVEEHRADPRSQVGDAMDGYVATGTVVKLAQEAGFRLDAKSEINANPKDTKNHPFGVWTLPPTRQSAARGIDPKFDHSKYDAIGESDRMTLRFKKPG